MINIKALFSNKIKLRRERKRERERERLKTRVERGVVFFKNFKDIMVKRWEGSGCDFLGATLSPFDSFLLLEEVTPYVFLKKLKRLKIIFYLYFFFFFEKYK